jgi:peptide/nickel transport system substrate-binding protein
MSVFQSSSGLVAAGLQRSRGWAGRWRFTSAIGLVALLAFSAHTYAASAAKGASSASAKSSGTVTFALPPGFNPNYILPIEPAAADSVQQFNFFQFLLYRPLYWEGKGASTAIDPQLSLAALPVYTGKTVTIHLKSYKWSDGTSVTSRDLEFFMNLVKANKNLYASYTKGLFPDDVASYSSPNARTFVLHLKQNLNHAYFTNDELNLIQPMPQHVWDKTSVNGKVGNLDRTTAGAKKVYAFLNDQAKKLSTYGSNPLWKVVDGPWKISSFSSTGPVSYVPNPQYSGPFKPKISKFTELPFTSATAEENVLRTGGINYGYVTPTDTSVQAALRSQGFSIKPWLPYQFSYIMMNFNTSNATSRAEFRQLYIRQALQHLVDEPGYIKAFFGGFAVATNGPVPINSSFADSTNKQPLYPFSISAAKQLLSSHGWTVQSSGTVCAKPGTGAQACGAGIPKGAKLSFHLLYYAGYLPVQRSDETFQSNASRVGITISLSSTPLDSIFSDAPECKPSASACKWQMGQYGGWTPFGYPVVASFFLISSSLNSGSYNDPITARYVNATIYSNSSSAMKQYQDYIARQVPALWQPSPDTQVSAISSKLKGVGVQSPTLEIQPETWSLSG